MPSSHVLHPSARLARLLHNHRPERSIVLATPIANDLDPLHGSSHCGCHTGSLIRVIHASQKNDQKLATQGGTGRTLTFMEEMKASFDRGKARRPNPAWKRLSSRIEYLRATIVGKRERKSALDLPATLREIKLLTAERLKLPYSDWFDPNYRRLLYVRYADDFLIGIIGSKEDAKILMSAVAHFLATNLKLRVSEAKSGISKATTGTEFLSYAVQTWTNRQPRHNVHSGRRVISRAASDRVQLRVPREKLATFVERRRLGNVNNQRGRHRPELFERSDVETVLAYNTLLCGLAEYYKLAFRWKDSLSVVRRVWWFSLMTTLAGKAQEHSSCDGKKPSAKEWARLEILCAPGGAAFAVVPVIRCCRATHRVWDR